MAVAVDPKSNPGQRHSDDQFDFDRREHDLDQDKRDLDSLGNADPTEENEKIGRARRALADGEQSASGPAKTEEPAQAEKYASIPFQQGATSSKTSSNKKPNRLRIWMISSVIATMIAAGGTFYSAITGLQRNLIEQATRETRQFFSRMYQESIKPYLARYLAKYVFGNYVGIADCAGESGTIVQKDCFYRHRSTDYPKTFVGRAFQAWKDGKIEQRIFQNIDLRFEPDAVVDPATGRRGGKWTITTPAGAHTIDTDSAEADTQRMFEFTAQSGPNRTAHISDFVMAAVEQETRAGLIDKARARAYLERVYGIKGCNFYCQGTTRINQAKSKLTDFKEYTKGLLVLKLMPRQTGLFLACFMSKRDHACLESDSKFRQHFAEETQAAVRGDGSDIDRLLKLADEAKRSPNLTAFLLKKVLVKLAEKISPALASSVTSGIPIAGQIIVAIATGWSIFSTGVLIYYVHSFLSSPQGQYALTMIKAIAFSGAFNMLSLFADERNGAKQVYDPNADAAIIALMDNYEHSLVWQSQYGNVEGLKNFQTLFNSTAKAAELPLDAYPNVCNANGDTKPANELICPQFKFDYTSPVLEAAQRTTISGTAAEDVGDAVAAFGEDVNGVVSAPFDAAAEAALETEFGKEAMDALNEAVTPLIEPAMNEVFTPPYDGIEDMKGAKLLDGAWAGGVWTYNEMARGGLNPDGSPNGWARVLSEDEVKELHGLAVQDIETEFNNLPFWEKMLSTEYKQSLASRFAFSAPNAINSPFQFVSSILSPLTGMRFAALSTQTASAQITPASNIFHIPMYGAPLDDIRNAPMVDENDQTPCENDRTPKEPGTPGTVDRGLGRAENTSFNSCLLAQSTLERYSAYDSNEPLDTSYSTASATLGVGEAGVVTGDFIWPIEEADYSHDSSCWGQFRGDYYHAGMDMLGKAGDGKTKIVAVDGGEVITAANSASAGGLVIIKHGTGLYTMYMHMDPARLNVKVGDAVGQGAVLGYQSHYGQVIPAGPAGSHLHFTVSKTGFNRYTETENPLKYLPLTGAYKERTSCSV